MVDGKIRTCNDVRNVLALSQDVFVRWGIIRGFFRIRVFGNVVLLLTFLFYKRGRKSRRHLNQSLNNP